MKNNPPLPQEKKLTVVFRVEPGCLGPDGKDHVEEFCTFAGKGVESIDSDFVHWVILPRHDKSMPEMEYKIGSKNLTHDKAAKYLEVFAKNLDDFESHLHEKIALLIGSFMER